MRGVEMSGTAIMCVYVQDGNKTKYVGIFSDPLSSADPDDAIVAIPNRNGGFGVYTEWSALKQILEADGQTNLVERIEIALKAATFGNPARHRPAASRKALLQQLKTALGVTATI